MKRSARVWRQDCLVLPDMQDPRTLSKLLLDLVLLPYRERAKAQLLVYKLIRCGTAMQE